MLETAKEDVVSGVKEITQLFIWHLEAAKKSCSEKTENEETSLGVHE